MSNTRSKVQGANTKTKLRSKAVSKRLRNYALDQKKPLFLGLLTTVIRTGLEIAGPLLIALLLNRYIKPGMGADDFWRIARVLGIYLVLYFLSGVFSNFSRIYFERAANEIAYAVRKDAYAHIQTLPLSYFDNLPAGSIVSRITNDTQKLKAMFQLILADILTSGIMAVAMYLSLIFINPKVGLLLLVLAPPVLWIFVDFRKKMARYTTRVREKTAEINSMLNESIHNMDVIQSFCQEDQVEEEFDEINQDIYDTQKNMVKLRSYSGYRAMSALEHVSSILVLFYFGIGKITGIYAITIGSLYLSIDYVTKLFANLNRVVMRYGDMEQAYASATHVFDIFKLKPEEEEGGNPGPIEGSVEFQDIHFAYTEEPVLKGIDFKVCPGETVAFVGETGAGKSTILNLLLRFYEPQEGRILIDGKDIKLWSREALRASMSVVLQDAFLFETSVFENVRLGDERFTEEDVIQALVTVGAEDIVKRGIHEKVSERGGNYSQGEKQLISFARAYIRNPAILILDEATSNIDTQTEQMIQRGIRKLSENRTTFVIAHRLSTIRDADCIYVLRKGKIQESGTHEELIQKEGYYRDLYEEQKRQA